MRVRRVLATAITILSFCGAACGFGVDLDNLFGDAPTQEEGGPPPTDAPIDVAVDALIPKVQVAQLTLGNDFACGRRIDGTVMCWGYSGGESRLGNGQPLGSATPVLVKDLDDAKDISAGTTHACAVRATGGVSCWGLNGTRQIGDGTTDPAPTPKPVLLLSDAVSVAAGGGFTCALRKDATVACWGDNSFGQIGDGTTNPHPTPTPVKDLKDVTQVVADYLGACALLKSGDVMCWGVNAQGQCGTTPGVPVLAPVKIPGLANVQSIAAGSNGSHFCAVDAAGGAKCWGAGGTGNLGNAQNGDTPTPTNVLAVSDVAGAAIGGAFTCFWRKNGEVACTGANYWRQLGIGDNAPPDLLNTPLPAVGLTGVSQVAAGNTFTCALHGGGQNISCWGSNYSGSLGRGSPVVSAVPIKTASLPSTIALGLGLTSGCAVVSAGDVWCWGLNTERELATNAYLASGTPMPVSGLTGATKVAGAHYHGCAVTGGQVKCWGNDGYGQLGQPSGTTATPIVFQAPAAATDVGGGYYFTCALLQNGQVACAGLNDYGRLGNPGGSTATPQLVQAGPPYPDPDAGDAGDAGDAALLPPPIFGGGSRIAVGPGHSCVIYGGGSKVACWGENGHGECGPGNTGNANQPYPADVAMPAAPVAVASGAQHTCAVLADQSIRCWGANDRGQVTGSASSGPALRQADIGKPAKDIAAGTAHTCALAADGTVSCWGAGTLGQLGSGVLADSATPVKVVGLTDATAIASYGDRTCAITKGGGVFCWGDNSYGQLGDGTAMAAGTPAAVAGY